MSVLRRGHEGLTRLIGVAGGADRPVIAVEATGSLHHAWVAELERRFAGSLRLFAPSETQAARTGLGSRRTKTDDRDCAALITLARQGPGALEGQGSRRCSARFATAEPWLGTAKSPSSASTTS